MHRFIHVDASQHRHRQRGPATVGLPDACRVTLAALGLTPRRGSEVDKREASGGSFLLRGDEALTKARYTYLYERSMGGMAERMMRMHNRRGWRWSVEASPKEQAAPGACSVSSVGGGGRAGVHRHRQPTTPPASCAFDLALPESRGGPICFPSTPSRRPWLRVLVCPSVDVLSLVVDPTSFSPSYGTSDLAWRPPRIHPTMVLPRG